MDVSTLYFIESGLRGWLPGSRNSAVDDEEGVIIFPYMLKELVDIKKKYNNTYANRGGPGFYKQIYNEIINICDETIVLFQNDFPNHPEITQRYNECKKESIEYVPNPNIMGPDDINEAWSEAWALKVGILVSCGLIHSYHEVTRPQRIAEKYELFLKCCSDVSERMNLSQSEVEAIVLYLREKDYIQPRLYNEFKVKKDTLLAMKALNNFAQGNNIRVEDGIELFCEYFNYS